MFHISAQGAFASALNPKSASCRVITTTIQDLKFHHLPEECQALILSFLYTHNDYCMPTFKLPLSASRDCLWPQYTDQLL